MLYYEETVQFEPDGKNGHWRSDYWEDFKSLLAPNMAKRGVYVVGVWETPVGAGRGNEFTFLYRTEDWASFGQFLAGGKADTAFRQRWSQQWVYRQHWYSKVIVPAPGHVVSILGQQTEPAVAPPLGGGISEPEQQYLYYEETTTFEPDGKEGHWRSDYWGDFKDILAPKMAEWGMPLVGVWETPVGAGHGNEVTFLWRTRNWTTFGEFQEARKTDTAFRQRWAEQWVYRESWYTKVIVPSPGHAVSILRQQAE
ncbi:MAG: hypothetical protein V3V35_02465 [Dehalococcoidia bacterium]